MEGALRAKEREAERVARVLEQVGEGRGSGFWSRWVRGKGGVEFRSRWVRERVLDQVGEGGGRGFWGVMWGGGPVRPTLFPKSGMYPEPYTPRLHVVQGKAAEAAAVALQLQAEEAARLADAELALAGEWRGEEGKITLVEGAGG